LNLPGDCSAQSEDWENEAGFWYDTEGNRLTIEELDEILARHHAWVQDVGRLAATFQEEYDLEYMDLNVLLFFIDNPEGLRMELSSTNEHDSAIMEWWEALRRDDRHADFSEFSLQGINLAKRNLAGAKLTGTDLRGANLRETNFERAKLTEAKLNGIDAAAINLTGANLTNAELMGASFWEARLKMANFSGAKLQGANFIETDLTNAVFGNADLNSVIFEPCSLSSSSNIALAANLDRLTYEKNPHALVELKKSFFALGFISQSKRVNAALQRKNQTTLEFVLYDLTCEWGSNHRRPLVLLAISWFLFGVLYWMFAKKRYAESNRYILASEKGLGKELDKEPGDWKDLRGFWLKVGVAFLFSLQRALRIGFREISPNHWLMMLLPPDFELKSRGWPRFVSGVQSLLSVALIVLSLLSYFGRPFAF
jgi:uncharacterized protein YjbI with pentapeptide repeats